MNIALEYLDRWADKCQDMHQRDRTCPTAPLALDPVVQSLGFGSPLSRGQVGPSLFRLAQDEDSDWA